MEAESQAAPKLLWPGGTRVKTPRPFRDSKTNSLLKGREQMCCPVCNTGNPAGAKFCIQCASLLKRRPRSDARARRYDPYVARHKCRSGGTLSFAELRIALIRCDVDCAVSTEDQPSGYETEKPSTVTLLLNSDGVCAIVSEREITRTARLASRT